MSGMLMPKELGTNRRNAIRIAGFEEGSGIYCIIMVGRMEEMHFD